MGNSTSSSRRRELGTPLRWQEKMGFSFTSSVVESSSSKPRHPKKFTVCKKEPCGEIANEIKRAVRLLAKKPKKRRGMCERCKRTMIRRLIRTPKPIYVGTVRSDLRPPNVSAILRSFEQLSLDCVSTIQYDPWIRRPTRPQRVPTGDPPHVREAKLKKKKFLEFP
ncbi:hypothetical protein QAD02_013686 [Eretmocerus hayati]|uniref:Uncharacterized protein n=1 Tax=Eretmocerus hayati TaxID=131215 RepID=A0ACC2P5U0_9HYME|nr:hypothetical protein QAD02_013686 [Eretmocerus hayati]